MNLFSRDRELTTTCGTNRFRHLIVLKHVAPDVRHQMLCAPVTLPRFPEGLDLIWTSRDEDAAQVGVAVALDEANVQRFEGGNVVVGLRIGVPRLRVAILVAVEEDDGLGKVGIVLDDVGQIGHRLSALVDGRMKGGVGVVDRVDCAVPAAGGMSVPANSTCKWLAYSGKLRATQSVSSFSSLAMTITLLPGVAVG